MSLRARILLLVLLAATLPASVFVHYLVGNRQARVTEAERNLSSLARAAAEDLNARVQATSQMLYGLARASDIDTSDRAACSEFLAKVLAEHPQYTGLLTILPDANLHCDSLRTGRNLHLADRAYFREALVSQRPAFELVFGRLTGIAVMQVALASRDFRGQVKQVLLASINLNRFVRDVHRHQPYPNTVVLVWDGKGMIMAAHPAPGTAGELAGTSLADSEIFRWLRAAGDGDTATHAGAAGVPKVWAVAVPAADRGTGLRITIGVPRAELTAEADRDLFAAFAALAATLLLVCAGALALAELGIRRPVTRIIGAVGRFSTGDLNARIGGPYPKGELGGLMAALDATADRLQAQNDEIRRLNEDLERRVAERTAEVERKNVELERASRMKSDFLANMSHELRTPLNSIIGFSEMLRDGVLGKLEAKQCGFAADIFDAGTHLLSLINDILDLSKVEAGMLEFETGTVDVAALLKASTLIVREKVRAHRIRLDTQFDPALGAMAADERKLKQIVYNLLSNAVKFTPEGGAVTLRARRCARAEVALDATMPGRLLPLPPGEDGEFLAITVEDNGMGIAEEHLAKLFEPFVQLDSSVSRRQGGTGLGLSLVRRLAELHGGTVGVASRAGAGSRFCVWLPWRAAATAAQEGGTTPGSTAPSTPEARAPGAPALPRRAED